MLERIIEFKEESIVSQFHKIDSRLRIIIYSLAGFTAYNFHKPLLITELLRTQEMQDEYYKNDEQYIIKPWQSVHQYGRGADISLRFFTDIEIDGIKAFLDRFIYDGRVKTYLIHEINNMGNHLHLQVDNNDFIRVQ